MAAQPVCVQNAGVGGATARRVAACSARDRPATHGFCAVWSTGSGPGCTRNSLSPALPGRVAKSDACGGSCFGPCGCSTCGGLRGADSPQTGSSTSGGTRGRVGCSACARFSARTACVACIARRGRRAQRLA